MHPVKSLRKISSHQLLWCVRALNKNKCSHSSVHQKLYSFTSSLAQSQKAKEKERWSSCNSLSNNNNWHRKLRKKQLVMGLKAGLCCLLKTKVSSKASVSKSNLSIRTIIRLNLIFNCWPTEAKVWLSSRIESVTSWKIKTLRDTRPSNSRLS